MRIKRRVSINEIVFSTALAGLLIGVHCTEVARQQAELQLVGGEARARGALLDAYERLRAGSVQLPSSEEAEPIEAPQRVELTIERLTPPAGTPPGLASVRLVATWRGAGGQPRVRELVTLVAREEAR